MPPLLQGSKANDVRACTYSTWHDLLERHGCVVQKAKAEYENCMHEGLWEEHSHVLYLMVDVEWAPRVRMKVEGHGSQ